MVDDDLFDDDSSDFDPFSGMDEEKPSGKKSGGGGSSKNADGTRSLAEFSAEVDRRIAILRSLKQPAKARIAAAHWLGECGDTRAIKGLVQVYTSNKSSRGLRAACKTALGKFKALDDAIDRMEGEEVEVALGRDENTWIVELLTDIAYNERPPRRRGRSLLLMNGVLMILLAVLFVVWQSAPTDAVSLSEITKNLGIGATGVPEPTAIPTFTATPAVDAFGNPLPTDIPPTPEPTSTPTPEPTATTVTADNVRSQLREMYAIMSQIDSQRGILDQLNINWTSVQADPGVGPRLCTAPQPEIPADIALPAGFAETEPALAQARDWINTGLATLRESWTYWRTGCTSGDLANRVNTGLQSVLVAKTAFDTAREFLNLVPQ